MKKNLKIVCIIILILLLLIPITYSYARSIIELDANEKQFFEISKTEFTKKEKVEMIINLDSINYSKFIFELKSDEVIEELEITQSDEIIAEKNNNEIVMEIDKSKTNINTINLFYSIPENKNVGDTIKFIATITSIMNDENQEVNKEESELPTENNETTKNDEETNIIIDEIEKVEKETQTEKEEIDNPKQETQSIELEIKIIEEKSDNKPETQEPNTDNNKQEIDSNKMPNKNNESTTTAQKIPTNYSNVQYNSMSNISISNNQVAKVTYKGSDNNYLNELVVDGYTFNRDFSKENTTYFITVEKEIEKLDITAKVDDDEANVTIYGNENLKEGTNKILITVTAENGDVRNYRIYVTKNI